MHTAGHRLEPRIAFWLSLCAALGITPFVVKHMVDGDWLMLTITGGLDVVLAGIILETGRSRSSSPRHLLISACMGALVVFTATLRLEAVGIFWAYPFIGFAYYFVGTRAATAINAVFCPAVAIGAYTWAGSEQFPRIVATLALTWLFSGVFSINNERQRAELARLASVDPLTGVANRRDLQVELERAVQARQRYGIDACVVLIDVDCFKQINDRHGHAVGDAVLVDLVRLLARRLRQTDKLFRMGGEEFLVLLPQTELGEAHRVAEDLRTLVEDAAPGGLGAVTVSAGLAQLKCTDTVAAWLKRADRALYRAKAKGRNRSELSEGPC